MKFAPPPIGVKTLIEALRQTSSGWSRAVDWPYSSFGRWVAIGLYEVGWGVAGDDGLEPALREVAGSEV
ncbi:MAG TPA: hypothetical protein VHL61_04050 [Luteimonas sp.]|nr:hypothetical protein [Luteimonas sp.]